MRSLILAGGRATRGRPLSNVLPKPMFPILDRPVIARVFDELIAGGITQIGITYTAGGGFTPDLGPFGPVETTWLEDPSPLGTAGSLRHHLDWFDDGPILVAHADRLTGVPIAALMAFHRADATLAVVDVDPMSWTGDVVTTEGPAVVRYDLGARGATGRLGWSGLCVVDRAAVEFLVVGEERDMASDLFPALTARGALAAFSAGRAPVHDVGVMSSLIETASIQGVRQLGLRPEGDEVRPEVWIGNGTHLPDDTTVVPPVVLGRDVRIGSGVRLRSPVTVGHEAQIGAGAHLERALVIAGAVVARGQSVRGRIVVGPNDPLPVVQRHLRRVESSPGAGYR